MDVALIEVKVVILHDHDFQICQKIPTNCLHCIKSQAFDLNMVISSQMLGLSMPFYLLCIS